MRNATLNHQVGAQNLINIELVGRGAIVKSVLHWHCMPEILGSNPGPVKPMTYKIDMCHFLASCSALVR